jgi:hypothetical protein
MDDQPLTPPATQVPYDPQGAVEAGQPTRHQYFYCTDATLMDPVILQVFLQSSIHVDTDI